MSIAGAYKFFDSNKNSFFAVIALFLWILRIPQTIPTLSLDRGVYVSSAERLLAGDKLYAEIFEAKDPIFIWQIALGRALSPLMDVVLENLWVFLASYSIYWLSKFHNFPTHVAIFIGFILSPIIITGVNYRPGYSHLPGIAVVFLIVVFLMNKSHFWAAFFAGLLLFLKIMLFPIAFLLIMYVQVFRGTKRTFYQFAIGATVGLILPVLILLIRGEFLSYLEILKFNQTYVDEALYTSWPKPIAHFLMTKTPNSLFLIFMVFMILVYALLNKRSKLNIALSKNKWKQFHSIIRFNDPKQLDILVYTFISLISSLFIIMLTGLWWHHNQIFAIPVICSFILLTQIFRKLENINLLFIFTVLAVLTIGVTGINLERVLPSPTSAKSSLNELTSLSAESMALLQLGKPIGYARIGTNDDNGHAYGLRNWRLTCRVFQIYPIYPRAMEQFLEETLSCLPNANVIIVSPEAQKWFAEKTYSQDSWQEFINQVDFLLEKEFICSQVFGVLRCLNKNRI